MFLYLYWKEKLYWGLGVSFVWRVYSGVPLNLGKEKIQDFCFYPKSAKWQESSEKENRRQWWKNLVHISSILSNKLCSALTSQGRWHWHSWIYLWMTQIHRSSWDGTTALSWESQFDLGIFELPSFKGCRCKITAPKPCGKFLRSKFYWRCFWGKGGSTLCTSS